MARIAHLVGLSLLTLTGCTERYDEFALPRGDIERGRATFVTLQCNACHSVKDSVMRSREAPHPSIHVELGGRVSKVKTYEELVTSIVNPSHKFSRGNDPRNVNSEGKSNMRNYNEVMTVQQLVDLTMYLSSQYAVWSPRYVARSEAQ